jgi:hypothetical protein
MGNIFFLTETRIKRDITHELTSLSADKEFIQPKDVFKVIKDKLIYYAVLLFRRYANRKGLQFRFVPFDELLGPGCPASDPHGRLIVTFLPVISKSIGHELPDLKFAQGLLAVNLFGQSYIFNELINHDDIRVINLLLFFSETKFFKLIPHFDKIIRCRAQLTKCFLAELHDEETGGVLATD